MKQFCLERFNQNGYYLYRVPRIVSTNKGTILVCFECRHGYDWSAMDPAIRRSTDGGSTRSERGFVASGKEIDVIHNGILFADGNTYDHSRMGSKKKANITSHLPLVVC